MDVLRFVNDATTLDLGQEGDTEEKSLNEESEGEEEDEKLSQFKEIEESDEIVTLNEFRESIGKVELFLKQSDFLFDSDDIQLFSRFKSRLDLIQ